MASPGLGSVSSLPDSVLETPRPNGDALGMQSPVRGAVSPARAAYAPAPTAAALVAPVAIAEITGSPSPEVMRLRERTSALIRSMARSPVAGGDSVRTASRGGVQRSPLLPLELSMASGETRSGSRHLQQTWREGRVSRSGPSSPCGKEFPRVAWQDGTVLGAGLGPLGAMDASPMGGKGRRRTRSGPGSAYRPLLDLSAAAGVDASRVGLSPTAETGVGVTSPAAVESGVRVSPAALSGRVASPAAELEVRHGDRSAVDPPVASGANFSQLEDEVRRDGTTGTIAAK